MQTPAQINVRGELTKHHFSFLPAPQLRPIWKNNLNLMTYELHQKNKVQDPTTIDITTLSSELGKGKLQKNIAVKYCSSIILSFLCLLISHIIY